VNQLQDWELTLGYFKLDGAACHTPNRALVEIKSFFGDRIISTGIWPSRSPYMPPLDFFLCDLLKDKLFKHKYRTVDDMKSDITNETVGIPPAVLAATFANMELHLTVSPGKKTRFNIFCNQVISTSTRQV
jgi:hypothetical protein